MTTEATPRTTTCPQCGKAATIDTDWLPSPGLDSRLRRYVCTKKQCGHTIYRRCFPRTLNTHGTLIA